MKSLTVSPLFNVLMFSAVWAFQIFFTKLGFLAGALVIPFQILLMIFAAITVAVLILPKSGHELGQLYKKQQGLFWRLYLVNGLPAALGTCLVIYGIALTDAVNAGFLVKITTATTILFSWLILKEHMSGLKIAVVLTMLFGAYLLTTRGQSLLPGVGDLFIFGACICWSLGDVLVRQILKTKAINADVVTIQKPLASFPVFLALIGISIVYSEAFGVGSMIFDCCRFSPEYLPYAMVSGICWAMSWVFLYRTLDVATASYLTIMSMVTPIIVSVLALVFLDEKLVPIQIAGAGLIILSGIATYRSDIPYR